MWDIPRVTLTVIRSFTVEQKTEQLDVCVSAYNKLCGFVDFILNTLYLMWKWAFSEEIVPSHLTNTIIPTLAISSWITFHDSLIMSMCSLPRCGASSSLAASADFFGAKPSPEIAHPILNRHWNTTKPWWDAREGTMATTSLNLHDKPACVVIYCPWTSSRASWPAIIIIITIAPDAHWLELWGEQSSLHFTTTLSLHH